MHVGSKNVEASINLLGDEHRDRHYKKDDWIKSSSSNLDNDNWPSPQEKIKDRGTKYRQQDNDRINCDNIQKRWSNQDENWNIDHDQEQEIPKLRKLSSMSQTTMSTDQSTVTGELSKLRSKSNSIFTDHDDDDESLSTVAEVYHSKHTGECDDFLSDNDHSPPNTLLSSPIRFWKRIGFYWCQLNGETITSTSKTETTTCCLSSTFSRDESDCQSEIGDSRTSSRKLVIPQTPQRASKERSTFGEDNLSPTSVPVHQLRTAKRGNGTFKTRERWRQKNLHNEHSPVTQTTVANTTRTYYSGESRISSQPDFHYVGWDGKRNHFVVTSPEKNDGSTFDARSYFYSATNDIQDHAQDDVIHHQIIPRKVFTNSKKKKMKQYKKANYCSNTFWSSPLSTASSDSTSSSSVFWSPVERKTMDNFLGSDSDDGDQNTLSPITTASFYEKGRDIKPMRQRVDTFDTAQSHHTRNSTWYEFDEKSLGQIFTATDKCIDDETLSKKDKRGAPMIAISHFLFQEDHNNNDTEQIISPCSTITNYTEIQHKPLNVIPSNDLVPEQGRNSQQSFPVRHQNVASNIGNKYRQVKSENATTENSSNKENNKSICNDGVKYFTPMSGLNLPLELSQNDYLTLEGWIVCHLKSTMPTDEESIVKNHCFYMRCYKSHNDGAILYLWRPPSYPETKAKTKIKNSKLRKNNRQDNRKKHLHMSLHSTLSYTSTKMEMVSQSLGHGVTVNTINKDSGEAKELFILPLCIDYDTYTKALTTASKTSSPKSNLKSAMTRRLLKNSTNEDSNRDIPQPMSWQQNGAFLSSSSQQTNATLHLLFCLDIANQKKLVSPQGSRI